MYCHHCGAQISDQDTFCRACGRSLAAAGGGVIANPIRPRKSKEAAGILAILLGGLGVHKFYMGNVGLGVLYLLFCWTFIPLIVGFIEGIIYLTEDDSRFQARLR